MGWWLSIPLTWLWITFTLIVLNIPAPKTSCMDKNQLWKTIIGEIKLSASQADIKTFFPQMSADSFENNILTLTCNSPIVKERVESRYYNQIKKTAEKVVKEKVELAILVKPFELKTAFSKEKIGPLFNNTETANKEGARESRITANLFEKYTFENFIVGANNRLAHTVAMAISENPGKAYNPFFIYSGVGLGKTHLMQAIGNRILEKFPKHRVVYCPGESFTNELVESIRLAKTQKNALTQFKDKFRKADVLLIDDVQFIAGREATQEEFFNAFNSLFMAGKQIVLTSDKHPSEIQKLEKRLSSRFASGMIADMQMPDTDMRSAILRSKKEALRLSIPNEICDFIAQNTETNIRELEGMFTQIITRMKSENKPFILENVKEVMGKTTKSKNIAPTTILKITATYFSVKLTDLKGHRRLKEFVLPRQVAMFLTRTLTELSLTDIGNLFEGRDHTTVLHSTKKIEKEITEKPKLKQDVENIKISLGIK
ncbi:MAG: chromosomal replication initiator protein DnaA [Patescibacteria group bacterium]|nr:chromosomal replication initiator protein DnaA [Patescibacteria group bacterium]